MRELAPSARPSHRRAGPPHANRPRAGGWTGVVRAFVGGLMLAIAQLGCASPPSEPTLVCETPEVAIQKQVVLRVESDRAERFARQVEQLSADLAEAEDALVRAESGLRGSHSRADAVSSLAEARIQVERASAQTPWRPALIREARAKLEDAGRQIEAGHFGAALFFVYRAERLADDLEAESDKIRRTPGARFVTGRRVNLRAGPSTNEPVLGILDGGTPVFPESRKQPWVLVRTAGGSVGWVHGTLLSRE